MWFLCGSASLQSNVASGRHVLEVVWRVVVWWPPCHCSPHRHLVSAWGFIHLSHYSRSRFHLNMWISGLSWTMGIWSYPLCKLGPQLGCWGLPLHGPGGLCWHPYHSLLITPGPFPRSCCLAGLGKYREYFPGNPSCTHLASTSPPIWTSPSPREADENSQPFNRWAVWGQVALESDRPASPLGPCLC